MTKTELIEETKRLIDSLPEDSTWDDLMHEIYVRQTIEKGLADSHAGRVHDMDAVRAEFGLSS